MGTLTSIFDKPWKQAIAQAQYLCYKAGVVDCCPEMPWKKTFAFIPRKVVSGKRVWLKTVFKRKHIFSDRVEYGTILDVVQNKPMEE